MTVFKGLQRHVMKIQPSIKLSSYILYCHHDPPPPGRIKGTMSHLQAKKMKMLNYNGIWKTILIKNFLTKRGGVENVFKWENNDY